MCGTSNILLTHFLHARGDVGVRVCDCVAVFVLWKLRRKTGGGNEAPGWFMRSSSLKIRCVFSLRCVCNDSSLQVCKSARKKAGGQEMHRLE